MKPNFRFLFMAGSFLLLRLMGQSTRAEDLQPPALLIIEVDNVVGYVFDNPDPSKFGTDPKIVPNAPGRDFVPVFWMADVTAVNGKPAKGTWTAKGNQAAISPAPTGGTGTAVGDSPVALAWDWILEIQNPDGTPIGTIMCSGWGGTAAPPGSPSALTNLNMAVTGGTGAYFGIRGQAGLAGNIVAPRIASIVEDPAARRSNGGGRRRYAYYVLPYSRPTVIGTASGPAIVHSSDFSLVTAAKPASAGEMLSMFATGLGPTRPSVDAGQSFPASPLSVANSPIEVLVSGVRAQVSFAGGFPGSVANYQVNFQIPDGSTPGNATLGLTTAFIPGPTVQIPIR